MFVYNVKINGSKAFKIFFITVLIILLILLGVVIFRVFSGSKNTSKNSSCTSPNDVNTISASNYTNILNTVHNNIDTYVGTKIKFTGYVYRVLDLTETQFVLARDMVVSSDYQSVVVGFLCEYEKAKELKDNTWVEVTGEITKGNYHGDMPIVRIITLTETAKPNDEYVYPPDESYIPTSEVL